MATVTATGETGTFAGHGTKPYRAFVLGMLLLVYTFNFIDRVSIDILQEPIREEFGLSDGEIGLLKGLAFAFLYTLIGIPLARLSERANRITILSVCVAIWSLFTALCGMAGNFLQLLAARVGVGIGEAGCTPPAQSVIADYFPSDRRATALSIYSMGIHLGAMAAAIGGAWIATEYGWRNTFLVVGAPGLLLAIIVKITVREPPRSTPASAAPAPGFAETLATLRTKPAFWHMALGGAITSFVGYGVGGNNIPFLMRVHHLKLLEASQTTGVILGVFALLGTFLSGFLADRIARRRPTALAWLPALGMFVATPLYLAAYFAPTFHVMLAIAIVGIIGHYFYLGPMYTVASSVVHPNMRATTIAIMLFVVNMIGYALGPPFIGALSDFMSNHVLAAQNLSVELCRKPAAEAAAMCAAGRGEGLRYAMMIGVCFFLWAGVHYLLAGRTLQRDRVS